MNKPWMKWIGFVVGTAPFFGALAWSYYQTKEIPEMKKADQHMDVRITSLEAVNPLILKALDRIERKMDRR